MINARAMARDLALRRKDRQEHLFWSEFREALEDKELKPDEFSVRAIFEAFVPDGHEIVESWSPRYGGGREGVMLYEAGDAVKTSDFSNITGQIVYTTVMDAFDNPAFIWPQLVNNTQTNFDGEKIPGISRIGDEAEVIGEAQQYPYAGVSEEYIETPSTTKRGFIVPVTKEAVFFDRTNQILTRAGEVSYWLGMNKEKRVIDMTLGQTNSLYSRNGQIMTTLYANSGAAPHDFDNLQASNALQNFTDLELAERLLISLTDPNTGEPINIIPNTIIIPPALRYAAASVLNATSLMQGPVTSANDTIVTQTNFGNPLSPYKVISTQLVRTRSSSDTTWWIGEPKRAFTYMVNWDITSAQAPVGSEQEFQRDIVQQYKVSERGTVAIMSPRHMVQCTA